MPTIKRRTRTGCLTCRARRVKCDEGSPRCARCLAANVECRGYQQPQQRGGSASTQPDTSLSQPSLEVIPHFLDGNTSRGTGLNHTESRTPLVAIPNNPRPDQRPGPGARHVLGYHQVLFSTIPLLFPPNELQFWKEELFQEAWSSEYVYLTLVSLGSLHRAALMTTSGDERDNNNGLDIKITAVQTYIQALQELSKYLEEARRTPKVLVAVLCLMAYFEAFSGNIPAFIGRVQSANYYFTTLILSRNGSLDDVKDLHSVDSLQNCLQSLKHTCYEVLPLRQLHNTDIRQPGLSPPTLNKGQPNASIAYVALQSLSDLVCSDRQIESLIWSPLAPHARDTPTTIIHDFEAKLRGWKARHLHLVPDLHSEPALDYLLIYKWEKFPFPPPIYKSTDCNMSLTAAYYNFFMARLKWALLLLGDDVSQNQISADFYFYEALRFSATRALHASMQDQSADAYIPCEALNFGLLSILHITALCSPQRVWLDWIKELSEQIVQEGVLKGHTYTTNMDCLHIFEACKHGVSRTTLEQYPPPAERIICQLIPETDGRHFTSYFAAPGQGMDPQNDGLGAYQVIGHARWKCHFGERPCTPEIELYEEGQAGLNTFSLEWLQSKQPALEWISWSQEVEFHMDRALEDHISGTRLLLAVDETNS